jgi:hypothetical protein
MSPTLTEVLTQHWPVQQPPSPSISCAGCSVLSQTPQEHATHVETIWRAAHTITAAEQLDALPAGTVVRSAAGTIAARFDATRGVVFGDDRPFPWQRLELDALVLWELPNDSHPPAAANAAPRNQ